MIPAPRLLPPQAPTAQKRSSTRRGIWRAAAAVWAGNVLVLSLIQISPGFSVGNLDKVWHFSEYVLLAWLLVPAWHKSARKLSQTQWRAWGAATLYGAGIEIIQNFIPYRSGDWTDAAANALGAAAGVLVWLFLAV